MRIADGRRTVASTTSITTSSAPSSPPHTIRVLLDQIEGDAEAARPVRERRRDRGPAASGRGVYRPEVERVLAEESARAHLAQQIDQRVAVLAARRGDGDGLAGTNHLVVAHTLRPHALQQPPLERLRAASAVGLAAMAAAGIAMPAVFAITHTAASQRTLQVASRTIYLSRVYPSAARALQVQSWGSQSTGLSAAPRCCSCSRGQQPVQLLCATQRKNSIRVPSQHLKLMMKCRHNY